MQARAHATFTMDQYFAYEALSEEKHEFVNGQVFAMAGGSPRHSWLSASATTLLRAALDRCLVFQSDLRVHVEATGLITYPDGSVTCEKPRYTNRQGHLALANPTLLVEVLSPSTREYDEGEKRESYQQIPSLRQILLIDPDTREVASWSRTTAGWVRVARTTGTVPLEGTDAVLDLVALFDGIERVGGD